MNKFNIILFVVCFIGISLSYNNFVTDSWISIVISGLDNAPKLVSLHSAALNQVNNTMIIFGGKDSSLKANNNLNRYDLVEDTWILQNITAEYINRSPAGSIPSPRYGHVALSTPDNKMYIFGGRDESQIFNDIYKYDMINDVWELIGEINGTLPEKRWGHSGSMYLLHNSLYFHGGAKTLDRDGPKLNDLVVFNFEYNTWQTIITYGENEFKPPALFLHSTLITSTNEMIVFGGKGGVGDSSYVSDKTFILALESATWLNVTLNSTSIIPDAKYGHSAVLTPLGTMLVFAGNDSSNAATSSVYRFNNFYKKWDYVTPSGVGPEARSGHTSITTPFNTMITFGGQSSGSHYLNDLFKYNIINSVLRSSTDGTTLVVLLSLVGALIIGLCFALDIISEKNEIARLEMLEKDAIAKNNEIALKKILKERKEKNRQPLFEKF